MISDRPFPSSVTVTLVDGSQVHGQIASFNPYARDLTIEVEDASVTGWIGRKVSIPGETLAVVQFRSALGSTAVRTTPKSLQPFKIHLVTGITLAIRRDPTEEQNPLGFYALPIEADRDTREYFVYSQGIRRRELDQPLGAILVERGLASPEVICKGLNLQKSERELLLGQILIEHGKVTAEEINNAVSSQQRKKLRIGEVLVDAGLITQRDVDQAVGEQARRRGKRVGEILLDLGLISEHDLMRALSEKFGLQYVDLGIMEPTEEAVAAVPRGIIENLGILPLHVDEEHLVVAICDPLAFNAGDLLRSHVKKRIVEVLAAPSQLAERVERVLAAAPEEIAMPAEDEIPSILRALSDDPTFATRGGNEDEADVAVSDSGVVRLVNRIITEAYRRGASDIHVEPNGRERPLLVRLRVDGHCERYYEIPSEVAHAVVARIKIMASLDISERRKPQDGKIRFRMPERVIELRVATLPTVNDNEDVVMRILASSKPIPLEKIGLSSRNFDELSAAIQKPYGLVLCVGPTGSGKTTTLHSALAAINTDHRKIWTAEDPVEITQPGLRQVQVAPKIGFTFEIAMRAFLRADPDVIMVGEMRDRETAGTAVEASLTGHLVLSTLHTNSAPETITRLLDMGLDPFSFSDALLAILAQRLARSLCAKCKESRTATDQELGALQEVCGQERFSHLMYARPRGLQLYSARGCPACSNTGYKGRIALHELLIASPEIRQAISNKAEVDQIRDLAVRGGMLTLAQDGIDKVLSGSTDLKQVLAVCSK